VRALCQAGWEALPFPLLEIGPSPEPHIVRHTVVNLLSSPAPGGKSPLRALMVVSGAALIGFIEALGPDLWERLKADVEKGLRFWVTGPDSAKTLIASGIPIEAIDYPGDSSSAERTPEGVQTLHDTQSLWHIVKSQVNQSTGPHKVLMVRGADEHGHYSGNPWMGFQLEAYDVQVHSVLAYQRLAPPNSSKRQAIWQRATHGQGPCIWVFSSSQGLRYLPQHDWTGAHAVATHPRIAAKVHKLGFSDVQLAAPGLESVIASLKSIYD
jgi:uroporphyrinogen-III synthase